MGYVRCFWWARGLGGCDVALVRRGLWGAAGPQKSEENGAFGLCVAFLVGSRGLAGCDVARIRRGLWGIAGPQKSEENGAFGLCAVFLAGSWSGWL